MTSTAFIDSLVSDGPAERYRDQLERFGQLVGDWTVAASTRDDATGEWTSSELRWSFSYVLDGRAVQDVITDARGAAIGTSIRVYDRPIGAWRVSWFGSAAGDFCSLVALPYRDGIRQDGSQTDGRPIRWNFSAITPESFVWDAWVSDDEGATWWHEQHLEARRAVSV